MKREDVIREIQERYRQSGPSLNELQRRHWAATEAMKIGRGGITIVSKALRISPNTIKKGMQETATLQADSSAHTNSRIRKPGGGRKSKKMPLDRSTRTRSKKDGTDQDAESRASDHFTDHRSDVSQLVSDLDSMPINDNTFD